MVLARVTGTVTCTVQDRRYAGRRIMVVQPVDARGPASGKSLLAVDGVRSGVGDLVVVFDEGGSARAILGCEGCVTIRTVIGAIGDSGDVEE